VAETQPPTPTDPASARAGELPTVRLPTLPEVPSRVRLFGSRSFFRLWAAQVVSSLGDWLGLVAVISIAARVGGSSDAAVGVVMSARIIPGFFLASVGGVLVDRWDRKRVMVVCDVGRGLVFASLPFIKTVWGLFLVSLLLEILTLMWSPAKEASVPNLVAKEQLTTANSLSLVAAYGTFPIGSLLFAALAKVADVIGSNTSFEFLHVSQETLAIYFDVLTFFLSALLISSIRFPRQGRENREKRGRIDLGLAFTEIREGWHLIGTNPVVRAVMVGLATGLMGGGMVVPLGPSFSKQVLHGGAAGFGLLLTALGMGVAVGVIGLSAVQKRLPREQIFPMAILAAGGCMFAAACMSSLAPAMAFVAGMGVCAGASYVVGFTILQENVEDELRGRIFAALYTLVRLCLIVALTLAPLLSGLLNRLSTRFFNRQITVGGFSVGLPGGRLTLWLGAIIIIVAGVLASRAMRAHLRERAASAPS
jgi:dTMP kinase